MAPERGSERDLSNLSYEFTVRTGSPIRPETLCAAICDMPGLALPEARPGTPKTTIHDMQKSRQFSETWECWYFYTKATPAALLEGGFPGGTAEVPAGAPDPPRPSKTVAFRK